MISLCLVLGALLRLAHCTDSGVEQIEDNVNDVWEQDDTPAEMVDGVSLSPNAKGDVNVSEFRECEVCVRLASGMKPVLDMRVGTSLTNATIYGLCHDRDLQLQGMCEDILEDSMFRMVALVHASGQPTDSCVELGYCETDKSLSMATITDLARIRECVSVMLSKGELRDMVVENGKELMNLAKSTVTKGVTLGKRVIEDGESLLYTAKATVDILAAQLRRNDELIENH